MSRKTRRKITRRKRLRNKSRKRNGLVKHLEALITNRFTRITTYIIIFLEVLWIPYFVNSHLWQWIETASRMTSTQKILFWTDCGLQAIIVLIANCVLIIYWKNSTRK